VPEIGLPTRLEGGKILFSPASPDLQYALVVLPGGGFHWLLREKSNAREWRFAEYDMTAYRGQRIELHFGTFNDPYDGVTAMFVDDVSLEVCFGAPPTATPSLTPTPTATRPPMIYLPLILRNFSPPMPPTPTPTATPPPSALVIDGRWADKVIGDRFRNVIYAYADGRLYRSPDDGATWNLVTASPAVDHFIMSAADPNVLYSSRDLGCLAGWDVPVYKSTNGGASWGELSAARNLKPLLAHIAEVDWVFAAGCDAPYLTTDGGVTWTAKPDISPESLFGIYETRLMAAAPLAGTPPPEVPNWQHIYVGGVSEGGSGAIIFTGDLGTTWSRITPLYAPNLWWISALEADPFTEGRLWFADPHGVWATNNNGAIWEFTWLGLEDVTYKDVPGATYGLNALVSHPTGRLYLGTVRGLYWKGLADPVWHKITGTSFDNTEITGLLFTETNPGILYVNTVDGVYRYTISPEPPGLSISVLTRIWLPPGSHPHGVDVDLAGNRVFVGYHGLNHEGRHLAVIDGETLTISRTIDLGPQAMGPNGVVYLPSLDRVYVANRNSNNVSVVDATAGTVLGHIAVGNRPNGITDLGNLLYVANFESESVSVINALSNTVTGTITPLRTFPSMVVADEAAGFVYVTLFGTDAVYHLRDAQVYNARDGVPRPYGLAFDPVRRRLYVANRDPANAVTIIDVSFNTLLGQINVGREAFVVGYNPNTGHLFVVCGDEVRVYDTADNSLLTSIALPPGAEEGIAVDTVRNRVYITSREGDAVTVISDPVAAW